MPNEIYVNLKKTTNSEVTKLKENNEKLSFCL